MSDVSHYAVSTRLKTRREALGVSLQELADSSGISKSTLQRYETGAIRGIPLSRLRALASGLNTTPEWILGLESISQTNVVAVRSLAKIPIIGAVRAGYDALAFEEFDGYDVADVGRAEEYFFLKVKGDSMAPAINEGELALVHKQDDVLSGEIAIIIIGGESGTIKKVLKRRDGLILQPFNPNYPPLAFSGEELANVRIVGRILETKRKW